MNESASLYRYLCEGLRVAMITHARTVVRNEEQRAIAFAVSDLTEAEYLRLSDVVAGILKVSA